MARVIASELQSKGSVMADQLVFTSGVWYISTSGDRYYNRHDSIAEELDDAKRWGRVAYNEADAWAMWEEYTADHWSVRG